MYQIQPKTPRSKNQVFYASNWRSFPLMKLASSVTATTAPWIQYVGITIVHYTLLATNLAI